MLLISMQGGRTEEGRMQRLAWLAKMLLAEMLRESKTAVRAPRTGSVN